MISHKSLWRKCWRESRTRFFSVSVLILFVIAWEILDSQHAMNRFDRKPPITFAQYVAYVSRGRLQLLWVASVLLLGLGGLVREAALGTAQFTLTLPFRRRDWMRVRALLGLLEAAAFALIPVVVIPLASRMVGQSYPAWEALKFSALLFAAGIVFFCAGLFWSSLLTNEFSAIAASGISLFLVFAAQDYLYRLIPSFNLPYFNMSGFLAGYEFVNRTTGFLQGWPWAGILKNICAAFFLFWISTKMFVNLLLMQRSG